ncbi:MAG: NAD(+)/NADH kinase, partial [Nanoarchaeota archaeon]|nr:NAD(+)/NADH kinase [Nanoarchaeota archaeon]
MFNLLKQKEVRKISKVLIVNKDKKCSIEKELKQKFPDLEIKSAWKNKLKEEHFKDIDLVISIGGDGTFLSASHFIDNQLILGVNNNVAQSEGALCSIDLIKLEEKISKIIQGNYTVKEY